jgi:hypothetical protein
MAKRTWNDLSAKQKKALAIGQALRLALCIEAQANILSRHCYHYGLPGEYDACRAAQWMKSAIITLRSISASLAKANEKARQEEKQRIKLLNEWKKEQDHG